MIELIIWPLQKWWSSQYCNHGLFREIGIGSALTRRPPFRVPLSCCRWANDKILRVLMTTITMMHMKIISRCFRNLTDPGTLQACQSTEFISSNFAKNFDKQIYFDQVCIFISGIFRPHIYHKNVHHFQLYKKTLTSRTTLTRYKGLGLFHFIENVHHIQLCHHMSQTGLFWQGTI